MSRLLVVTPRFHGYGRAIARAFGRRGHQVVVHEYDTVTGVEKAWNKVRHELPARLAGGGGHMSGRGATYRAVRRLEVMRPDLVLTVRGDVLGADYWEAVARWANHSVVWLYDELRNMDRGLEDLVAANSTVATYSRKDARSMASRGIDAHHVPLAFQTDSSPTGSWPTGVVSFVGARLASREDLLTGLVSHGVPVRAHGRDWSSHPVDQLRTWRLSSPALPGGRDVSLRDAYGIMRDSAATLNIHGDQDGFTMRTFEACGVGAVQIIDRDDVVEFYEPGVEVLVQHSLPEAVEMCRAVLSEPNRVTRMRRAAQAHTMAEHTLDHRVRVLEELW